MTSSLFRHQPPLLRRVLAIFFLCLFSLLLFFLFPFSLSPPSPLICWEFCTNDLLLEVQMIFGPLLEYQWKVPFYLRQPCVNVRICPWEPSACLPGSKLLDYGNPITRYTLPRSSIVSNSLVILDYSIRSLHFSRQKLKHIWYTICNTLSKT